MKCHERVLSEMDFGASIQADGMAIEMGTCSMNRSFFIAPLVALSLVAACADDSSSDGDPSATQPNRDALLIGKGICEAEQQAQSACGPGAASQAELKQCQEESAPCYARLLRPEAATIIFDCFKDQQCSGQSEDDCACTPTEDQCFARGAEAFAQAPEVQTFYTQCMAKLAECGRDSNSFGDDWCAQSGLYADGVREGLTECFGLACGDYTIGTCLNQKTIETTHGACRRD